jgi:hypothetical protein
MELQQNISVLLFGFSHQNVTIPHKQRKNTDDVCSLESTYLYPKVYFIIK